MSEKKAKPKRAITVEVSPGELIDKMTTLQIKQLRFDDPRKLQNVTTELDMLTKALDAHVESSSQLDELTAILCEINNELWEFEDEIRVCERENDFGSRFIELARAVYHTNDRRSRLKREINDLLDSHIVEEKQYAEYE